MKKKKALKIAEIACDVSLALGTAPDSFTPEWISFSSDCCDSTSLHIEFEDLDGNICIFCDSENVSREEYRMLSDIAANHGIELGEGYF